MSNNNLHFGAHVSIRHGYEEAAKFAHSIGGKSFQYFPKNPRGLTVKKFNATDAARCKQYCLEQDIQSIAHTPYPTNLAVDAEASPELFQRTVDSLSNDLEIAEACGTIGVIVHFGTYKGNDPLQGYQSIIHCLNTVLHSWEGSALLLIENQSGEHSRIGMTFEELVQIRKLCRYPEKIGFCLDTCHAFASGLWDPSKSDAWVAKGKELDYWKDLHAVHLNDSKHPFGSYRDRHANIGTGYIGKEGFQTLLQYDPFHGIPLVLETPSAERGSFTHQEEIKLLQTIVRS